MKEWVWRLWLAALVAGLLLLFVVQWARAANTVAMPLTPPGGQVCEAGKVTRHDAFYSMVLQVFPERATPGVHGYVGVRDCNMMGRQAALYLGGYRFRVAVADCLNRKHIPAHDEHWAGTWLADVDLKLWLESGVPARPVEAVLCWD